MDETELYLLLLGPIADLVKGKSELLIENALLRQQLIILRRQVKRPLNARLLGTGGRRPTSSGGRTLSN